MTVYIASDHGGYKLKSIVKRFIQNLEYKIVDLGTDSEDSVDYTDYAEKLCIKVQKTKAKGILICGTGIGMSIAANKFKGVRAALCSDEYSAKMSRKHNDTNVLCLGGRVIGQELASEIIKIWLETDFSEEDRHQRRIAKIDKLN